MKLPMRHLYLHYPETKALESSSGWGKRRRNCPLFFSKDWTIYNTKSLWLPKIVKKSKSHTSRAPTSSYAISERMKILPRGNENPEIEFHSSSTSAYISLTQFVAAAAAAAKVTSQTDGNSHGGSSSRIKRLRSAAVPIYIGMVYPPNNWLNSSSSRCYSRVETVAP